MNRARCVETCCPDGLSSDDFRAGMRQLAAAVSIVTAEVEGVRGGLTATAVMSLSAEPPRLVVSVNKNASAFALIERAGCFAVNVLQSRQLALAAGFSGGSKGEARFAGAEWRAVSTGAPVLVNAAVSFDCSVHELVDVGTHALFIGDVRAVISAPTEQPLLYRDGGWHSLARLS